MQEIRKIVLTGGPCAGKTTAMSWVQNAFTEKGYKVLFVPETATELISGGVAPGLCRIRRFLLFVTEGNWTTVLI